MTVAQIRARLSTVDQAGFEVLKRALAADTRKGVVQALESAQRRLDAQRAEDERLERLYDFERELAASAGGDVTEREPVILGLDEVGRGPLAGPLAVGGVVLRRSTRLSGLNDSKQVPASLRETIAEAVRKDARAWTVEYISPADIDAKGMTACLKMAFSRAIAAVERQGVIPDVILLDGNALHLDAREVNVVKGDARCASIAAASIVAKVARDALMVELDASYPGYHFAECKGYASPAHIEAIKQLGLSPVHRATFCTAFTQPTLF